MLEIFFKIPLILLFVMYLFWSGRLTVQLCAAVATNSYVAVCDGVVDVRKRLKQWRSGKKI